MPEPVRLTPTSYLVLGLVARMGPVTSYEMKQRVAVSIGHFWPFPHSQLYAEPVRLVAAGLLAEDSERTGRRRRRFRLTPAGRRELRAWLAEPTGERSEVRDLGLLKLFFAGFTGGPERRALAAAQLAAHEAQGAAYEALQQAVGAIADPFELHTLEAGLRFERAMAAFWRELLGDAEVSPPARTS